MATKRNFGTKNPERKKGRTMSGHIDHIETRIIWPKDKKGNNIYRRTVKIYNPKNGVAVHSLRKDEKGRTYLELDLPIKPKIINIIHRPLATKENIGGIIYR